LLVRQNKRQLFLWVLGFFFLVLCSKVLMSVNRRKQKKRKKPSSFSPFFL